VDVADPRDARVFVLYSISSRKASTEPKPLCPVSGEGGRGFYGYERVTPSLVRKVPGRR
jgi:hypothetical protein